MAFESWHRARLRLKALLARRRLDRDLSDELSFHLDMRADEARRAGATAPDARARSQRRFGNLTAIRETVRDLWTFGWMETLWRDLRLAGRLLRREPGFTAVAALTLALGIGATTSIFSVINAVLLRPLPYPEPERLVAIRSNQSLPDLEDIAARTRSFDAVGGVVAQPLDVIGNGDPIRVWAGLSNVGLFKALGARTGMGRLFTEDEDRYGGSRVVVLSHAFWATYFGADPRVVGTTISLSGNPYAVVGVLSADFWTPGMPADVWASLRVVNPVAAQFRGVHFLDTYLRLKPDVTPSQAEAEMRVTDQWLEQQYPDFDRGRHRLVMPLREKVVASTRQELFILFGAVGLMLLIACTNFANLLLARTASRRREIMVRTSLGAGSRRLVSQILTESLVLAVLGGTAGVLLAWWGIGVLPMLTPPRLPRLSQVSLDGWVLTFAVGISLVTGLAFGLIGALSALRLNVSGGLREAGRHIAGGHAGTRARRTLVTAEIALALVLVVGAGLLIKSFWLLSAVDPGFRPDDVLTVRLELPEAQYAEIPKQQLFRTQLLGALNARPSIQAAMISEIPMGGESNAHQFLVEGQPPVLKGAEPEAQTRTVAGDYFHILGVPLRKGRGFTPQDGTGTPLVVVVNERFVQAYLPNEEPLGARIRWSLAAPGDWMTIVGVVGDVKHFGPALPEEPAIYDLYAQTSEAWKRWMYVVVRGPRAAVGLSTEVTGQVRALDRQIPTTRVRTMHDVMGGAVDAQRFNMTLLTVFAAVALALAAIGIYGVVAYAVARRTPEIGIRMALGAQRRDVGQLIVKDGGRLTAIGTALGLAGALSLTHWMSAWLFGVSTRDPFIFLAVALIMSAVATLASYIPARRAMRIDPIVALRTE